LVSNSLIMVEFTSDNVVIKTKREKVFQHLLKMENYEALFPQDKISEFEASETGFSVKIAGQGRIRLEKTGEVENEKITLSALDDKPFKMDLNILLQDSVEGSTDGHIFAEADLNPFIKMVAQKPLNNLFNSMTKKLASVIDAV